MIDKYVEQVGLLALSNEKGEVGVICSDLESEYGGGMTFFVRFKSGEQRMVTIKIEEV